MNITKRFLSILLFTAISVGAWALEQDSEGYYFIGSVQDWKDFAALVETTPTANAKMIADIDLGDDQTMIGTSDQPYGGTFDGQGYTLTVDLNVAGMTAAPFRYVNGATLQRIHVAGSVHSTDVQLGGLVATGPNTTVKQCRVSALLTVDMITTNIRHSIGGIFSEPGENVVIEDCIFDGQIAEINNHFCGGFVNFSPSVVTIRNSMNLGTFPQCPSEYYSQTGTFIRTDAGAGESHVLTNVYYKNSFGLVQGTQVTSESLADGSVAYKLQNGRDDLVWGQRIGTDSEPVLTSDENYRVYMSKNGGYTNNPSEAYSGLQKDATDGYYLIGSLLDWLAFAALVNDGTEPAAKARMTADIDLGSDQTNIVPNWFGEESPRHYHGTFDGQGHTLTVHYNSSNPFHTPFGHTSGATIKNLHVAGSITSNYVNETHLSGLVANSAGSDVIQNVWVSVDITSGGSGWIECGAFIGCNNCGTSTITDCLFTGSLTTTSGNYNGCFVGYVHSGETLTSNSLSTGTFTLAGSPNFVEVGTITNSYVKRHSVSIPDAMQVTDANLANGTTTAALNGERTGDDAPWIQDPITNQPMLKIFVANNSGISTSFIPIENGKMEMGNEANGWYSISGQKLNGKPVAKGVYIHNGKKMIVN